MEKKTTIKKKNFLKNFINNPNYNFLTTRHESLSARRLLSYIYQINIFLEKKKLTNKTIIIQFKNRLDTFIFYLASIFSKTTICSLDPRLPRSRVNKIKNLIKAKIVLKKINLIKKDYYDLKNFNLENHNFLITFSSGTSGEPKGIVHSTDNLLGSSSSYSKLAKYNKKTRILHCLPEYYMAGIVNTFLSGFCSLSKIFIIESFNKKSIFGIWMDIEKFKINLVYLVPSIYAMIVNFFPKNAKKIIKLNKINFLSTSNNLYSSIRKTFFRKFGCKIKSCYGITEMGGPLTNETKPDLENDSVGKIIKNCKIKIKKLNNKNLLYFKSKYKCEYLIISGKKKKLELDRSGYFGSLDSGYIKNKNIILTGREKDILKKGGELIYLKDIENIILESSFVEEVAAVGIADNLSDEKLYLYIVLKKKNINTLVVNNLLSIVEKKMYKTERPDKIIFIKKMPKTLSGKIIKRKLLATNASNKIREIVLR
jgi:long-chain acyl-CoA synthetase